MKQSSYLFSKTYFVLKFQPSRWTMAPSRPIFSFRSLNKLGPLVDNFKIAISGRAHPAQDKFSQVWLTSVNFKDNLLQGNGRTVDNPYMPVNAKKKKWMQLPQGRILEQFLWSKAAIRFQKHTLSSNFSLLGGPWLRLGPFSRFGHKTNYPKEAF